MSAAALRLLLIGETGDGKSTLVNALRASGTAKAEAGLEVDGVTKDITQYPGRPINGTQVCFACAALC